MDAVESGVFSARQPLERYQWPLGFAVGFLVLWLLIGEKRRNRRVRGAAAALIALAFIPGLHAASSGLQDYQSGNYDQARKIFEQQLKSTPDSREVQFNAGASAYKLGDFEQAVSHFTNALLSEDNKLRGDAAYNLANSLVRRGEAARDNAAKKADWKNAIEQYTEALKIDPKNKQAIENRDIVKKLLEDLEKQEKQQQDKKQDQKDQKQDQQNKDQKQDQKDNKDQQNKDQQNKDQQNKDQKDQGQNSQNKDQQDKQDQNSQNKDQKDNQDEKKNPQGGEGQDKKDESKDNQKDQNGQQDKKDQDQKPQDKGDQQGKSGPDKEDKNQQGNKQQQNASPTPTPGEKKEGDVKANGGDEKKDQKPDGQQGQAAAAGEEQGKDGQMSQAQARALLKSLNSEEEKVNLMQQPTTQEVLRDW